MNTHTILNSIRLDALFLCWISSLSGTGCGCLLLSVFWQCSICTWKLERVIVVVFFKFCFFHLQLPLYDGLHDWLERTILIWWWCQTIHRIVHRIQPEWNEQKKKFICEKCTLCSVCIYQTKKCLILELNLNLTVNTSFAICAFVLPNISPIKKIRKSLSLQTTSIYSIIFLTSFGISLLASFSQRFFFQISNHHRSSLENC